MNKQQFLKLSSAATTVATDDVPTVTASAVSDDAASAPAPAAKISDAEFIKRCFSKIEAGLLKHYQKEKGRTPPSYLRHDVHSSHVESSMVNPDETNSAEDATMPFSSVVPSFAVGTNTKPSSNNHVTIPEYTPLHLRGKVPKSNSMSKRSADNTNFLSWDAPTFGFGPDNFSKKRGREESSENENAATSSSSASFNFNAARSSMSLTGASTSASSRSYSRFSSPYSFGGGIYPQRKFTEKEVEDLLAFADKWIPTEEGNKRIKLREMNNRGADDVNK